MKGLITMGCVDLYPFFGPDDPNGPHTDAASQSFLRRNAAQTLPFARGIRPGANSSGGRTRFAHGRGWPVMTVRPSPNSPRATPTQSLQTWPGSGVVTIPLAGL